MLDIYFRPEYGKLCQSMEEGVCKCFEYRSDAGYVRNMYMKRPVPWQLDGVQYYDAITPYGYGGPVMQDVKDRDKLAREYEEAFREHCLAEGIVAEFVRFHPIFDNRQDFDSVYETVYSRHTVGTNLQDFVDPVQSEFSKSARKETRRAINAGLTCSIHPQSEDLSIFRRLYEETMERNQAPAWYYFPDAYYDMLTSILRPYTLELRLHYEGEVIASELYFADGGLLHAHLLGSNQKMFELYAGALFEATAAQWGKENGYRYIHHGGGRSSAEDDPLYLYKKKFGKNTEFDFYMGKKVWNRELFDRLVELRLQQAGPVDPGYFPPYRA